MKKFIYILLFALVSSVSISANTEEKASESKNSNDGIGLVSDPI